MTDGLFSLKKILTDSFEIPPYQRSYVWTSNETESKIGEAAIFFKDLIEYNNNKNKIKRYLFGPLIVQSKQDDLKQIIDGQQRITTVMIFLCAARDLLNHSGDSKVCNKIDAEAIIDNYIKPNLGSIKSDVHKCKPKLIVADKNYEFFVKEILQPRSYDAEWPKCTGAQKNMMNAYKLFYKKLDEYAFSNQLDLETRTLDSFEELLSTLINRFEMFYIETENISEAYHAFETLNFRGAPLKLHDLIKNYYFSLCSPRGDSKLVESKWSEILDKVGSDNMDQFIRYCWVSKYGNISHNSLFRSISLRLTTPDQVQQFVNELANMSKIYHFACNPVNAERCFVAEDLNSLIKNMHVMKSKLYLPLLFSCVNKQYDEKKTYRILKQIETYILRNTIITDESVKLTTIWKLIANEAVNISSNNFKLESYLSKIKEITKDDETFANDLEGHLYRDNDVPKMILQRIFKQYGQNYSSTITLEHIYPQSTSKTTQKKWSHFNYEDHDKYCYNIGNMTLLIDTDNSTSNNHSFDDKKGILSSADVCDNIAISHKQIWDEKSIKAREEELIQKIVNNF